MYLASVRAAWRRLDHYLGEYLGDFHDKSDDPHHESTMSQSFYSQPQSVGPPRITWGVQRIVLLCTAVFAAQLVFAVPFGDLHEVFGHAPGGVLIDWLAFSIDNLLSGLVYTVATYMVLHGSLSHLFFNMVWLVCFGPEVERFLGTRRFYSFFAFCGIAGVLANFVPWGIQQLRRYLAESSGALTPELAAQLSQPGPLIVGASGAVLGVLVVFAMIDPEGELQFLFLPFRINRRALIIAVIALNLLQGAGAMGSGGIAIATHIGGMVAGYAYFRLRHRIPTVKLGSLGPGGGGTRARKPLRKPPRTGGKTGSDDLDHLGREVDNIFNFDDRKRGD
jgi:membrane associated rhomboid family serine protease